MAYILSDINNRWSDKRFTPLSGGHSIYKLSRTVGCDASVIEAIAGHAQKRESSQYGSYPDEVLGREVKKIFEQAEQSVE